MASRPDRVQPREVRSVMFQLIRDQEQIFSHPTIAEHPVSTHNHNPQPTREVMMEAVIRGHRVLLVHHHQEGHLQVVHTKEVPAAVAQVTALLHQVARPEAVVVQAHQAALTEAVLPAHTQRHQEAVLQVAAGHIQEAEQVEVAAALAVVVEPDADTDRICYCQNILFQL